MNPVCACMQILANLVMETLHPQLRDAIAPRLRGKMQQRQRNWMLVTFSSLKQTLRRITAKMSELNVCLFVAFARFQTQCTGRCSLRPAASSMPWWRPVRCRRSSWTLD